MAALSFGQTTQLTCHVEANPPAHVTWYKYNGIRIVNEQSIALNPNASSLFTPTVLSERLLESFYQADITDREFKVSYHALRG